MSAIGMRATTGVVKFHASDAPTDSTPIVAWDSCARCWHSNVLAPLDCWICCQAACWAFYGAPYSGHFERLLSGFFFCRQEPVEAQFNTSSHRQTR